MASVYFTQPQNMFDPFIWYGQVTSYSNSWISLSDGYRSATYYGNFYFNNNGLAGGTVTGYSQYVGGSRDYSVEGINLDAMTAEYYLDTGNALGLQQYALLGADTIHGSSGSDAIQAWSGNDHVYGYSGNDILNGDSGNDTLGGGFGNDRLNGGDGVDTAYYAGPRSNYTVVRSTEGYSIFSGTEGTDSLISVEFARFTDQTAEISSLVRPTTIDNYNPAGIYRFFNQLTGTHFYTGDKVEAESVLATLANFSFDGLAFEKNISGSADSVDVLRFYNENTGTHFYTSSQTEANIIKSTLPEFNYEGVAYEAHNTKSFGTTELYRFFNALTGTHFYTADQAEMENVKVTLVGIMNFEGVAYYVDV